MKFLTIILLVCLLVGCDKRRQPTGQVKYNTRSGVVEGAIYNTKPIHSSITTIYDIENERYFTVRHENANANLYKEATLPGSKGDTLTIRLGWPHNDYSSEDSCRQVLPAEDIPKWDTVWNNHTYLILRVGRVNK